MTKKFFSTPTKRVLGILRIKIIKSITTREVFKKHQEIKKQLYGGNLWTSGYYVNTVSEYANREVIINYVKNQGQKEKDYKKLYS